MNFYINLSKNYDTISNKNRERGREKKNTHTQIKKESADRPETTKPNDPDKQRLQLLVFYYTKLQSQSTRNDSSTPVLSVICESINQK